MAFKAFTERLQRHSPLPIFHSRQKKKRQTHRKRVGREREKERGRKREGREREKESGQREGGGGGQIPCRTAQIDMLGGRGVLQTCRHACQTYRWSSVECCCLWCWSVAASLAGLWLPVVLVCGCQLCWSVDAGRAGLWLQVVLVCGCRSCWSVDAGRAGLCRSS